jgi:hypothetical protein
MPNEGKLDLTTLPGWLLGPLLAGSLIALSGGYWDDAWLTERGRDDFDLLSRRGTSVSALAAVALYGVIIGLGAWLIVLVRRTERNRASISYSV